MNLFNKKSFLKIRGIEWDSTKTHIYSKGLKPILGKEFTIERRNYTTSQISNILEYLTDFVLNDKPDFEHGETISCFSWSLRLNQKGDYFHIYEFYPAKKAHISGVSITLKLLNEQLNVCSKS